MQNFISMMQFNSLDKGKELAILSIGYADGLVDSIKQMLEIE